METFINFKKLSVNGIVKKFITLKRFLYGIFWD